MSVAIQLEPEVRAQAPEKMFEGSFLNIAGVSDDVAADGQRFIMLEENIKQPTTIHLNVVTNWFETLKQQASSTIKPRMLDMRAADSTSVHLTLFYLPLFFLLIL